MTDVQERLTTGDNFIGGADLHCKYSLEAPKTDEQLKK